MWMRSVGTVGRWVLGLVRMSRSIVWRGNPAARVVLFAILIVSHIVGGVLSVRRATAEVLAKTAAPFAMR
jgi:hypothetical protein